MYRAPIAAMRGTLKSARMVAAYKVIILKKRDCFLLGPKKKKNHPTAVLYPRGLNALRFTRDIPFGELEVSCASLFQATAARGMATHTVDACAASGIDSIGITKVKTVYKNLSYEELREHEERQNEGLVTNHDGCFAVDTGVFTGRSPKDKWFVKNAGSESEKHICKICSP